MTMQKISFYRILNLTYENVIDNRTVTETLLHYRSSSVHKRVVDDHHSMVTITCLLLPTVTRHHALEQIRKLKEH